MHRLPRTDLPAPVGLHSFCLLPSEPLSQLFSCSGHRASLPKSWQWHCILTALGPLPTSQCPAPYHGRAVVIVFVIWFPGLEAAPAESMVAFGTGHAMEEASWSEGSCLWLGPHQECQEPGCTTEDALGLSVPLVSYNYPSLLNAPFLLNSPIQCRLKSGGRNVRSKNDSRGCQESMVPLLLSFPVSPISYTTPPTHSHTC